MSIDNVLVLGVGSIGQRHLQCLTAIGIPNLYICDPNKGNLLACKEQFQLSGSFADIEEALTQKYDAAIVAVPNHLHADVACKIISKGIPVLLEKPIEVSIDQAQRVVDATKKYDVVCHIAYCLRFHPAMIRIKEIINSGKLGKLYSAQVYCGQYLPDWRPMIDYRKTYSAHHSQGGGVCLDISHEFDYCRWLFGEPCQVKAFSKKLSELDIDAEDCVDCIMSTTSGTFVSIHLDYLSRPTRRKIFINAENGSLEYDFIAGELNIFTTISGAETNEKFSPQRNSYYIDQLRHFLKCVQNNSKCLIPPEDALKTLNLALRVRLDVAF